MSHLWKPEVISQSEIPGIDALRTRKNSPLILIVDDEEAIADSLSIILSRSGFSTRVAYSGEDALEIAEKVDPDLVISDVVMPGISGVELAIQLAESLPSCKILLFSGQAATVDLLSEARKLGHDFMALAKPIHPTELLRRISETLAYPLSNPLKSLMSA